MGYRDNPPIIEVRDFLSPRFLWLSFLLWLRLSPWILIGLLPAIGSYVGYCCGLRWWP
jgi:hypothetical protein